MPELVAPQLKGLRRPLALVSVSPHTKLRGVPTPLGPPPWTHPSGPSAAVTCLGAAPAGPLSLPLPCPQSPAPALTQQVSTARTRSPAHSLGLHGDSLLPTRFFLCPDIPRFVTTGDRVCVPRPRLWGRPASDQGPGVMDCPGLAVQTGAPPAPMCLCLCQPAARLGTPQCPSPPAAQAERSAGLLLSAEEVLGGALCPSRVQSTSAWGARGPVGATLGVRPQRSHRAGRGHLGRGR